MVLIINGLVTNIPAHIWTPVEALVPVRAVEMLRDFRVATDKGEPLAEGKQGDFLVELIGGACVALPGEAFAKLYKPMDAPTGINRLQSINTGVLSVEPNDEEGIG